MSDSFSHWEDLNERWSVLVGGPRLTEGEREILVEYLEHVGAEEAHKVGMVAKERKDGDVGEHTTEPR